MHCLLTPLHTQFQLKVKNFAMYSWNTSVNGVGEIIKASEKRSPLLKMIFAALSLIWV